MSVIQELDHLKISLHGVTNHHINYEMDDGMEAGPSGDGNHHKQQSSDEHHEPDKSLAKEITEGAEPNLPADDSEDDDTSGEDDNESSDDEEEKKAPVELLAEFLIYVREADWENAAKLCKMILIYEPNNAEALQFQSVIAEKVQVEKELAEMSSSSEEEESTDEEESEDDNDDDAEKSDDSNDDDDDEGPERPQSQIKNRLIFPSENKIWKP